ncbi:hypothetical protein FRC09_002837, partial [Ceratobasidium sp. 395]
RATTVCDSEGTVAAWVVPNHIRGASLVKLTTVTANGMQHEVRPKKKKAKGAVDAGVDGDSQDGEPLPTSTPKPAPRKSPRRPPAPRIVGKPAPPKRRPATQKRANPDDSDDDSDYPPAASPAGAHVRKRHANDVIREELGWQGVKHYARAWKACGQEQVKSIEPSRDLTQNGSNLEFTRRLEMLEGCWFVDFLVNHLVKIGNPDFSYLLDLAEEKLDKHLGVRLWKPIWPHRFFGHAIIANRETGIHTDSKGVRRGMDVLVAAGDFTGGELVLHDLNVVIPFLPGTLIAFDGTAQRHSIRTFSGTCRLSHVYFCHQSVFDELQIDTSTLPDLTVDQMKDSLEQHFPSAPPQKVAGKRKREGGHGGRSVKPRPESAAANEAA